MGVSAVNLHPIQTDFPGGGSAAGIAVYHKVCLLYTSDVALFTLLDWLLGGVGPELRLLGATVIARVVSSLCNFAGNRTLVFASRERPGPAMVRYYTLCVVQTAASYGGVYLLSAVLFLPSVAAKIITDTLLFFISFQIQRQWVFAPKKGSAEKKEEPVHD